MNLHTVTRRGIFYGLLMMLLAGAAGASDLTLTGDAHVNSARADTNYGGITNLYVGNGNTSLLMFDVSAVPTNTPATLVTQAMLRLYVNRVNTAGAVDVRLVSSSWSESSVTFNSLPTLGAVVATVPVTGDRVHHG